MVNWTEKCVERLKLLHKEGLSASVIAKKLGPDFTIGMVAGKIRRLGLTTKLVKKRPSVKAKPAAAPKPALLGGANARQSKPPRSAHARITVPPAVPPRPMPAEPAGPITGLRLYDLREGHCRWPVGEEKPAQFFCGAPALPSKSWCEHHYRMAYGHGPTYQNRVRALAGLATA